MQNKKSRLFTWISHKTVSFRKLSAWYSDCCRKNKASVLAAEQKFPLASHGKKIDELHWVIIDPKNHFIGERWANYFCHST
jgi:hypothetical protein